MAHDDDAPKTKAEQVEDAREQERMHRRLQQQGEDAPGTPTPRRERERHEAIDHAVEDVERSIRHAAERRIESTRTDRS